VLKHHRALLPGRAHRFFVEPRDLLAVEPDLPGVGIEQADQMLDEDALPDTRRPDDEEDRSGRHVEGHVVEDGLRAEGLDDVFELDQRFCGVFEESEGGPASS